VSVTGALSGAYVDLRGGADTLKLSNSANTLLVAGVETLNGGNGADIVTLAAPVIGMRVALLGGADMLFPRRRHQFRERRQCRIRHRRQRRRPCHRDLALHRLRVARAPAATG
jgi:hypothetical protein